MFKYLFLIVSKITFPSKHKNKKIAESLKCITCVVVSDSHMRVLMILNLCMIKLNAYTVAMMVLLLFYIFKIC